MMRLVLVALLLAPAALADHVYSHRFLFEGRLLGADGFPIPGREMTFEVAGDRVADACVEGHRPVTDVWGDFWFCYHRHEMDPAAIVTISSGGASESRALDTDLRRMVFYLRDPSANGTEPAGWASTYHVDGRVWERGRVRLEGVNVTGLAIPREPVNITTVNVSAPEAERAPSSFELPTNPFGDYGAILRLAPGERAEDVVLRVAANGGTREVALASPFHRQTLDLVFPMERDVEPLRPGTQTGPISIYLLAGIGLALYVAILLVTRKK